MLTDSDFAQILATSKAIIQASGETVTRRRLDTSELPDSFDSSYGEVVDKAEEEYDDVEMPGKVFFSPGEQLLCKQFGGAVECELLLHVAGDADVSAADTFLVRGIEYRVTNYKPAPLRGLILLALVRRLP